MDQPKLLGASKARRAICHGQCVCSPAPRPSKRPRCKKPIIATTQAAGTPAPHHRGRGGLPRNKLISGRASHTMIADACTASSADACTASSADGRLALRMGMVHAVDLPLISGAPIDPLLGLSRRRDPQQIVSCGRPSDLRIFLPCAGRPTAPLCSLRRLGGGTPNCGHRSCGIPVLRARGRLRRSHAPSRSRPFLAAIIIQRTCRAGPMAGNVPEGSA